VKISLHIDQIVIDGARLTRREREHLAGALQQDLARQLRGGGGGRGGATGGSRLSAEIAREVLAALPAGVLPGGALPGGRRGRTGQARGRADR
jgi:hypothetical protein